MRWLIIIVSLSGCVQKQVSADLAPAIRSGSENPHQAENDRLMKEVMASIAGREREAAGLVFENVENEALKKIPAQRFLRIMNMGYSRALGVACTHCHVDDDYASDEKRPKRAAREMAALHRQINQELSKMQHVEPREQARFINCSTCHRGSVDPMEGSF